MTLLDILILIPLVFFIIKGWKKGLVREVCILAGVLIGIWAAIHLSEWVAEIIGLTGDSAVLLAFFLTFVGALVIAVFIGYCMDGLLKVSHLNTFNRVAGAALGMVKVVCILSVVLSYIVMIDHDERLITPKVKSTSWLYKPVCSTGNLFTSSIKTFVVEHKDKVEVLK